LEIFTHPDLPPVSLPNVSRFGEEFVYRLMADTGLTWEQLFPEESEGAE